MAAVGKVDFEGVTGQVKFDEKGDTLNKAITVYIVKDGAWGRSPRVALEPVRKIGDVDTDDENLAFHYPSDVAMDAGGNMLIVHDIINRKAW